jgi:hypothetical protein
VFRVKSLEVRGLAFRVQGSGFGSKGLESRVWRLGLF